MTWAKTGVEFPDQCADANLSDAAYRTHHEVISYLYRIDREDVGDLAIPRSMVRRIAGSDDHERAVKELVACGFWHDAGDRYRLVHHGDIVKQSLMAQRLKRQRDKAAQQTWRERNKKAAQSDVSDDVIADPPSDVSDYTDRQPSNHRRGNHSEVEAAKPASDDAWPNVAEPGTPARCGCGRPLYAAFSKDGKCSLCQRGLTQYVDVPLEAA